MSFNAPIKSTSHSAKLYLSAVLCYGFGLLIATKLPHYKEFVSQPVKHALIIAYIVFLAASPAYYFLATNKYTKTKPLLILQSIKQLMVDLKQGKFTSFTNEQKNALLFMGVKLFFIPLMFQFLYSNVQTLGTHLKNPFTYSALLIFMFTLDTAIFAFGYSVETPFLKNTVKSVEPTLLGWVVALACYPPFNWKLGNVIPWGANDYVFFWNNTLDPIFKTLVLLLLAIYTLASVALGAKASNLTNRGIVTKFPYSIVRHPAYAAKVTLWWVTMLPVMSIKFAIGMAVWTIIYGLRAYTEERHLSQDEDYQKYKQKVKCKFFPGLF